MDKVVAIIVAGGRGSRMGYEKNKILLSVESTTILEMTLSRFEKAGMIDEIILVINKNDMESLKSLDILSDFSKIRKIVIGGDTRQESVRNGLKATNDDDKWILVHDAARPMIQSDMIDDFVKELRIKNQLIMAVPEIDTIKQINLGIGIIETTLERSQIWRAQTPQGFLRESLIKVYDDAINKGYNGTDDSSLMEWAGYDVHIYEGDTKNIKITIKDDLEFLKLFMKQDNIPEQ